MPESSNFAFKSLIISAIYSSLSTLFSDIAFTKFMYVKGWTRIVTNVSFWNATSGGKNYSFCINYAILYDTSHTSLQCRNLYTSDSAKVKVSITCLYYKDKLIGSNNIPS